MQPIKKNSLVKAFLQVKDEIVSSSIIELEGNRKAIVQGTRGILEYKDELIRVNLEDFQVHFYGVKLSINCFSQDSLEIKGIIQRVEYV